MADLRGGSPYLGFLFRCYSDPMLAGLASLFLRKNQPDEQAQAPNPYVHPHPHYRQYQHQQRYHYNRPIYTRSRYGNHGYQHN